jgi:Pvc16 N-terminal domain
MSSNTAIKDVTRGLQILLLSQLNAVSSAAQVSLLPPGEPMPSGLGVNLYLYRVMESAFTKNQPWPGDKKTPPSDASALGLELYYLLTPFAPAPEPSATIGDDAHTMLGAAMLALHQYPVLNDVHIKGFDADTVLPQGILDSFEQIKIRLAITSLEELSKIWATINQPYRLSVAYEVSLVELPPTLPSPVNGRVVLSTGLNVSAWQAPRLEAMSPATGALAHVAGNAVVANTLTISGSGLSFQGQTPTALFGGQRVSINTAPAPTDHSIGVTLPVSLDAGPNEDVEVAISGKSGAALTFTVSPWLSSLMPIRTALDTSAASATLILNGAGFTTTAQGVRFDGPSGTANVTTFVGSVTDTKASITIPSNLQNGLYQVRIVLAAPGNDVSNARTLEVIPLLKSPIGLAVTTVSGNQVHQLTLNGARLNGTDIRVVIDGVSYQANTNANAAQFVFTLGRLLDSGQHSVAVVVDGSRSHDVALGVS